MPDPAGRTFCRAWDTTRPISGLAVKLCSPSSRCVINLAPASEKDDTRLCSIAPGEQLHTLFDSRTHLRPQTFAYGLDPDFDLEAWQASVEGKAKSGGSLCTVADVVAAVGDGYTTTKMIMEHLTEAYQTKKRTIERLISKAFNIRHKTTHAGKYILGAKAESLSNPEGHK